MPCGGCAKKAQHKFYAVYDNHSREIARVRSLGEAVSLAARNGGSYRRLTYQEATS